MALHAQRAVLATACGSKSLVLPQVSPLLHARVSSSLECSTRSPGVAEPSSRRHARNITTAGIRRSPLIQPGVIIGEGHEDEQTMDIFNYLLRQRIIFLAGYINDKMATQIVGSLLALEAMDEEEDIRIYINSTGGQPYSVFGILDAIQSIKPDVQTLGLGCCYSYASLVLAAGAPGKRSAMKNTRIMMTQPMGGSSGDIYQIKRTVEELNAVYQMSARFYMRYTGMDQDTVERNTCRDLFMTPEEAMQQGIIDEIVRGRDDGQEDYTIPPSMVRQLREAGIVDDLTPNMLNW
eukprot:CAMPEP_0119108398 /NCGR_PEP_ID=MMETSP1180-20130426/14165_1 /TAXON_ID=3052 ORGANISM="Chlamydomonas cf sp, Strain CCMP681" /NCGR_SAMPLE_ID=MMETSP1180 /ASSEMBLY_ACC=CAM_ASM_000741 /LENGTH=292 /DNA_ID=CAMNT_0007094005 /DNA_START=14 /DNA_END=889 /DNA_ORIENTATION=+